MARPYLRARGENAVRRSLAQRLRRDVSRVWVRNHRGRGWFTVPWTHQNIVRQPFADFTWRAARKLAAARGVDDANEMAVASAYAEECADGETKYSETSGLSYTCTAGEFHEGDIMPPSWKGNPCVEGDTFEGRASGYLYVCVGGRYQNRGQAPRPPQTIAGDGVFLIGSDVVPGLYKSSGPTRGTYCWWHRIREEHIANSAISWGWPASICGEGCARSFTGINQLT